MEGFCIRTKIKEYDTFKEFAEEEQLGPDDLVLTNEYIYSPSIEPLGLGCQTLFQEKYGAGEPTDDMVNAILDDLRKKDFTRIIAVGGGTIIDIAKVVAVASPSDRVDDLYDHKDSLKKHHELIIVPTTCGTGSEVTNIAVINRVSRGVKMGLTSPSMYADAAAMITNMLATLPYKVFATSSIDAMIHAVESYLSPNGCSISRIFSEAALRTILKGWSLAVENGGNDAWKAYSADFLKASNWAGLAFGYAGCAAVHALSYPLGSVYHVPHGQSNQLMFADVMRKYKEIKPVGRINDLENLLAECLDTKPENALDALYALMDKVLKKEPLRSFGVKESDLPVFAKNVPQTQQRLLKNNYVPLTEEQILEIYKAAY
ncbi:MAG: 4-hydroxybutyrate dehydrogenase [Bilifractor sp.]